MCGGASLGLLLMIAWIMIFLPAIVGQHFLQRSSLFLILTSIGSHGVMSFMWFPIQAPRNWVALPSHTIHMHLFSLLSSCRFSLLVLAIHLYSFFPMGIILVFLMLKFTPDTWHQESSRCCHKFGQSCLFRWDIGLCYQQRSSLWPVLVYLGWCPFRFSSFLIMHTRGSIARSKIRVSHRSHRRWL